MHRADVTLALLTALALFPASASAQRTELDTKDLRLIYLSPLEDYLAPHAARCFENALGFHRHLWGYQPRQKVTVLLNDFADNGNAAASAVPRDFVMLEISPLNLAYETVAPNERMNWLMNHELVHVTMMDQNAHADRLFRGLFGGKVTPIPAHPESIFYFYLTAPRAAAPSWYQEGIAVFTETWMAGGRGRAQGAWDEMVFRSMVKDGSRFYDPVGLASEGSQVDFQVGVNNYLYGTRFMTYLADRYSPRSLIRWVDRTDGSKRYYASQFKKVFGKPLGEAWQDWVRWEHDFQQANLDAIRRYPLTPSRDISPKPLGSVSRAFVDQKTGTLLGAFNYPGVVGHIGAISLETGSIRRIVDVKQPSIFTVTSLAWDPGSRTLFYTADNYAYRDLVAVSPDTGKKRLLLKDARIGDLAFDPADRSLWGVRHFNGIATLVRIPYPYREWKQVYSWPYGDVMYDLDVSPDGTLLSASVGDVSGHHTLRVMKVASLLAGDPTPVDTVSFESALPLNFVFSPDGRYLYGSSYYTGVSNIFRYELATRELRAVSNTDTGFFRPIPLPDGTLIVFRYTGEGFVPTRIDPRPLEDVNPITFLGQQVVEKYPVLKDWKLGSPARIPIGSMITGRSPYSPLRRLGLESVYPVVVGYKDFAGPGVRINLSDPASLNKLGITFSYTPDSALAPSERWHADAEYRRYDWRAGVRWNGADFYDLFGPTKRSRKGYSLSLGHLSTLIFDQPREMELDLEGAFYGKLEQLPDFQNVAVSFNTLFSTKARLSYRNLRHSLGHVDEEKGQAWSLGFEGDLVDGAYYPKLHFDLDLGTPLPLKHSSIWLRSSAGVSPSDRQSPFSNFYFGGFGNNWVDFRDEKRYREQESFPGEELNAIAGRNYLKGMLEWNLPPIRFRNAGGSGFYLSWARPALFATGIVTNLDAAAFRRRVGDIGAQIDLRFTLLSRLEMTLSVGHALAFEEGRFPRHETMVSLKVLR